MAPEILLALGISLVFPSAAPLTLLPSSSFKDPCAYIGSTWIIQVKYPILVSFDCQALLYLQSPFTSVYKLVFDGTIEGQESGRDRGSSLEFCLSLWVCVQYTQNAVCPKMILVFPNSLSSFTLPPIFPVSVNSTTIPCHLKQKPSVSILYGCIQITNSSKPTKEEGLWKDLRLLLGMECYFLNFSKIPHIFSTLIIMTSL